MFEDPKYHLFRFYAKWLQPDTEDYEPSAWQKKDAPDGFHWNSTSTRTMYKEYNIEHVEQEIERWWDEFDDKKKYDIQKVYLYAQYEEQETWCQGWFSHWTFDVGQTDQEALRSFEKFVQRKKAHNYKYGFGEHYDDHHERIYRKTGQRAYCLMGAEDRWRWTARADGQSMVGFGPSTGDPPCRCDACRKHGVLRIDH